MNAPDEPARHAADDILLLDWLASHAAACPACGYQLAGSTDVRCSECGTRLRLGVRADLRLAAWLATLLPFALALGFDLVAAALVIYQIVIHPGPTPRAPLAAATLGGLAVASGLGLAVIAGRRAWLLRRSPLEGWAIAGLAVVAVFAAHALCGALLMAVLGVL